MKTVILIHGMGDFTTPNPTDKIRGSFGVECLAALTKAIEFYPSLKNYKIEKEIDFVEIEYNHFFNKIRADLSKNGKKISDGISTAIAGSALSSISGLVSSLSSFESNLSKDKFIYTHLLDVLIYKLYFGKNLRAIIAKEFTKILRSRNAIDVHVMAHSLGTAVFHDMAFELYNNQYQSEVESPHLSVTTHKLGSTAMIANVSRLANSILPVANPYSSIVRPGPTGMTDYFQNIHHQLDPFTLIRAFAPKIDANWIDSDTYQDQYEDIEINHISEINTHSITQYILNPAVHIQLFSNWGIPMPDNVEYAAAVASHKNILPAEFEKISDLKALRNDLKNTSQDLKGFFDVALKLYKIITK